MISLLVPKKSKRAYYYNKSFVAVEDIWPLVADMPISSEAAQEDSDQLSERGFCG